MKFICRSDLYYILLYFLILIIMIGCYVGYSHYEHGKFFNQTIDGKYKLDDVEHPKIDNIGKVKSMSNNSAKNLKFMYKVFEEVADKHNIKFWAWGGTLLGSYRHKGFIPWDDDMDFATDIKNKNKMLTKEFNDDLENKGVKLTYDKFALPIFRLVLENAKNISPPFIDIFFSFDTETKTKICFKMDDILESTNSECTLFNPEIEWNKEWIYPIKKAEFEDISIYVPNDAEKVIIQEFNKEALTNPLVQHNHAGLGWLLPATKIYNKSNNELNTVKYWIGTNPLKWGNVKQMIPKIFK